MTLKLYIKALYYNVEPTRCYGCRVVLPAFLFTIKNWHDINLCRRCFNKQYKGGEMEADYYQHFNPIGYFFFAFPFSLDFAKEMEQEKREKRKVRA